jgi:hypothetical protein
MSYSRAHVKRIFCALVGASERGADDSAARPIVGANRASPVSVFLGRKTIDGDTKTVVHHEVHNVLSAAMIDKKVRT